MVEIKRFSKDALDEILESIKCIYPKKIFKNCDDEVIDRLFQICIRERHYSVFTHSCITVQFNCSLKTVLEICNNCKLHITVKTNSHDSEFEFITPPKVKSDEINSIFINYIKYVNRVVKQISELDDKLDLTYLLPGCTKTQVLITSNFLEWAKFIKMALFSKNESELKDICTVLLDKLKEICPQFFNKTILKMKFEEE